MTCAYSLRRMAYEQAQAITLPPVKNSYRRGSQLKIRSDFSWETQA